MRPATTDLLLGIDVGTTWIKAGLVDLNGPDRPIERVTTPWRRVSTGAEADARQLAGAALTAARRAMATAPDGGRIIAVGVTGMAEAGVLLDGAGTPVAPVIAWHDHRGAEEAARLSMEVPEFAAHTGLAPTPTCTLVKHAHHLVHSGGLGRRWLNVPEWIVHRLGGEQVAELSLAARTGYLDLAPVSWWETSLRWLRAPPGFLPDPVVAGTPCGRATLLGLRDAVLTVAGHDHVCAAYGAGLTRDGDVLNSCGTAEALVRSLRPPIPEMTVARAVGRGLNVGWHVVPGLMTLNAGFASGKLLEGVDLRAPGARQVVAALAGKTATLMAAADAIAGPHRRVVLSGGWARVEAIRRAKSRALGKIEVSAVSEPGVRGAALLAGVAAGARGMPPARSGLA